MNPRAAVLMFPLFASALPALAAELITTPAPLPTPSANSRGVLPADEAFAFNTVVEADGDILLTWEIRPAFYLYRRSLKLEAMGGDLLPALELPEASVVTDEFFGESEVYFDRLLVRLPAGAVVAESGATIEMQLSYQGCLKDIYCYPPQHKALSITLP